MRSKKPPFSAPSIGAVADLIRLAGRDHTLGSGKLGADLDRLSKASALTATGFSDAAREISNSHSEMLRSARDAVAPIFSAAEDVLGRLPRDAVAAKVSGFDLVTALSHDIAPKTVAFEGVTAFARDALAPKMELVSGKGALVDMINSRQMAAEQLAARVQAAQDLAERAERLRTLAASGPPLAERAPSLPARSRDTKFRVICDKCRQQLVAGTSSGMSEVELVVPPHDCRKVDDDPTPPRLPN